MGRRSRNRGRRRPERRLDPVWRRSRVRAIDGEAINEEAHAIVVSPVELSDGRVLALRRLSDAEREERTNALSALRLGRRKGMAVGLAAAEVETSMAAIYRWVPEAVRRGVLGIPYATPRDRIWRLRPIYANGRLDFVELEGSDDADEAERIFDLQWAWIHGDRNAGSELQRYRGGRVGGQLVEADLDALRAIAAQGDDPPEVYRGLPRPTNDPLPDTGRARSRARTLVG